MKKKNALLMLCITLLIINPFIPFGFVEAKDKSKCCIIETQDNITDYVWSSDGTRIAYITCPDGQPWNGELWIAKKHPNQARILNKHLIYTGVQSDGLQDWQGNWILFMIRKEEGTPSEYYGKNELWKIRFNGDNLTQITFTYTNGIRTEWWNTAYTNRGTVGAGKFIPGTDLVYFTAHNGNGWYKAYTCKNDGTDQWQLISGNYFAFTSGMSPTGNKLVWGDADYWNDPTTLYASNVDGSDVVKIKQFTHRTFPLVLADGYTIIWSWNDGNINAINMDGSDNRIVIDDEYNNYWENYHPLYGQLFLMRSNRANDGNQHIFSIDTFGTQITQLTDGEYNDEGAIYSSNGRYIMYRRLPADFDKNTNIQPYPYELVIKLLEPKHWHWWNHWNWQDTCNNYISFLNPSTLQKRPIYL